MSFYCSLFRELAMVTIEWLGPDIQIPRSFYRKPTQINMGLLEWCNDGRPRQDCKFNIQDRNIWMPSDDTSHRNKLVSFRLTDAVRDEMKTPQRQQSQEGYRTAQTVVLTYIIDALPLYLVQVTLRHRCARETSQSLYTALHGTLTWMSAVWKFISGNYSGK